MFQLIHVYATYFHMNVFFTGIQIASDMLLSTRSGANDGAAGLSAGQLPTLVPTGVGALVLTTFIQY